MRKGKKLKQIHDLKHLEKEPLYLASEGMFEYLEKSDKKQKKWYKSLKHYENGERW